VLQIGQLRLEGPDFLGQIDFRHTQSTSQKAAIRRWRLEAIMVEIPLRHGSSISPFCRQAARRVKKNGGSSAAVSVAWRLPAPWRTGAE
jgi:hypothetical protein